MMKQPKEIIEIAEAQAEEQIAAALMDLYRYCGLEPWRVEIDPVFSEKDLEGFQVKIRSNHNGI